MDTFRYCGTARRRYLQRTSEFSKLSFLSTAKNSCSNPRANNLHGTYTLVFLPFYHVVCVPFRCVLSVLAYVFASPLRNRKGPFFNERKLPLVFCLPLGSETAINNSPFPQVALKERRRFATRTSAALGSGRNPEGCLAAAATVSCAQKSAELPDILSRRALRVSSFPAVLTNGKFPKHCHEDRRSSHSHHWSVRRIILACDISEQRRV